MYGYGHGSMFGGGFGMLLVLAIPILLLFLLGKSLLTKSGNADETAPQARTALEILDESYARGEIDRDTYLQKRDLLRKQ